MYFYIFNLYDETKAHIGSWFVRAQQQQQRKTVLKHSVQQPQYRNLL